MVGLLAAGGCGDEDGGGESAEAPPPAPEAGGLELVVSPETVEPGGRLQARVVNEGETRFTYGAAYELEREVDGTFERVDRPDDAVIQIAYVAKPGETGPPVRAKLPADAEPGRWRIALTDGNAPAEQLSAEFEVVSGG